LLPGAQTVTAPVPGPRLWSLRNGWHLFRQVGRLRKAARRRPQRPLPRRQLPARPAPRPPRHRAGAV